MKNKKSKLVARDERISSQINKVSRYTNPCFRASIEKYNNCSLSSLSIPAINHHWVIVQSQRGPEQMNLSMAGKDFNLNHLEKDEIIYVPPFTPTSWEFSPLDECTHLIIPDSVFIECFGAVAKLQKFYDMGAQVKVVNPGLAKLARMAGSTVNDGEVQSHIAMTDILMNSVEHLVDSAEANRSSQNYSDVRGLSSYGLNMVKEYMWDNIQRNIALIELANVAGMSVFYFARSFKERTGVAPHRYLLGMRVQKARMFLTKERNIAIVAYACGFCDQAHLSRVFKSFVGVTPGQFRSEII